MTIQAIADEARRRIDKPLPDNAAWFEVAGHKLAICDGEAETEALLAAYLNLIEAHYLKSEYMIAMRFAERGLDIAKGRALLSQQRLFHHWLGMFLKAIGDNGRAIAHMASALDLSRTLDDPLAECKSWGQLAATMLSSGQFSQTIAYARRALAIAGSIGGAARPSKVQCNHLIAEASLHLMHDPNGRQRHLAEGLVTIKNAIKEAGECTKTFEIIQLNKIYHTQTRLQMHAGHTDDARLSAEQCELTATQCGNGEAMLRAETVKALVGGVTGDNKKARAHLAELLVRYADRDDIKADIVSSLEFVCESGGDSGEAEQTRVEFYQSWGRKNVATVHRLLDQVDARYPTTDTDELNAATMEAIETMAVVGEVHDDETGTHVFRVGAMAGLIAAQLGMSEVVARQIDLAARLHDIGKLAIHADVMMKPGALTQAERQEMKKHTTIGAEMLGRITHPVMKLASEIAAGHHERWDGNGYPAGIVGDAIPLAARITAVADVFDALTHARCYKSAWSITTAITEISRDRGTAFDPAVVDAFLSVIVALIDKHGQSGLDEVLSVNSKENALVLAREFLSSQLSRAIG